MRVARSQMGTATNRWGLGVLPSASPAANQITSRQTACEAEMSGCNLSADLLRTARSVVEAATGIVESGGSAVHAALLASQLYEALKVELRASQRHESAKIGLLAAAIDQCRRAACSNTRPAMVAVELGATLALLESGSTLRLVVNGGAIRSSRPKPQLRLIKGGLSRSA